MRQRKAAAGAAGAGSHRQQQQRMLQQMVEHRREDQHMSNLVSKAHQEAFGDLRKKYLRVLALFVIVCGGLIAYFQPKALMRILFQSKKRLPPRSILTLYEIPVKAQLPRFFMGYAISTPENLQARLAVQHVANQRRMVTDPGRLATSAQQSQKQTLTFQAWEHEDFTSQLRRDPGAMDFFCGDGFESIYNSVAVDLATTITETTTMSSSSSRMMADDLLLTCLMKNGYSDGFVKKVVQVYSPINRGLQGVAAIYMDGSERVHADFLFLPILSKENLKATQRTPSTALPTAAVEFLLSTVRPSLLHDIHAYRRVWEKFLYETIVREGSSWVLLNAACTDAERDQLQPTQRLIASTCLNATSKHNNNDDDVIDDDEKCCSFYDPAMKPFRRRRDDHDDD